MTHIDDGVSQTSFAYNKIGKPSVKIQTIDGKSFKLVYSYDSEKRVHQITYPDGKTITREYSDSGYLKDVKWDNASIIKYGRFETDTNGNISNYSNYIYRVTGNNVKTKVSFDLATQKPTNIKTEFKKADNSIEVLEDIIYQFDNSTGNIQQITDNVNTSATQTFSYDSLNRLISANGIYGSKSYIYSNNGNLTNKGGITLSYSDANHPHAVTGDSNSNTYQYDSNGNMISRKGKTLNYDSSNRLISVYTGTEKLEEYFYDFSGHRIKKWKKDGSIKYNVAGMYELTIVPDRLDHHTKYFYGMKNEAAAQATDINSTLMAFANPVIIDNYYNLASFKGFILSAHEYLNYFSNNVKTYRYIIYVSMSIMFILIILSIIKNFKYFSEKSRFSLAITRRAAPVLLFAVFTVFGLTGCEITGDGNSSSPWDGIGVVENPTTIGLPVKGMYFFHPDYTGNVGYVTDKNGKKISQLHYKPYGEIAQKIGDDTYRKKFNSQEYDGDESNGGTGLYYYKARYYDPAVGRFITTDTEIPSPDRSQSLNRYSYVEGSPIVYSDPTGHSVESFLKDFIDVHLAPMNAIGFTLQKTFEYANKSVAWLTENIKGIIMVGVNIFISSILAGLSTLANVTLQLTLPGIGVPLLLYLNAPKDSGSFNYFHNILHFFIGVAISSITLPLTGGEPTTAMYASSFVGWMVETEQHLGGTADIWDGGLFGDCRNEWKDHGEDGVFWRSAQDVLGYTAGGFPIDLLNPIFASSSIYAFANFSDYD